MKMTEAKRYATCKTEAHISASLCRSADTLAKADGAQPILLMEGQGNEVGERVTI